MPERFEIYIVYKKRYINTLPFLSFLTDLGDDCSIWSGERPDPRSTSRSRSHRVRTPVSLAGSDWVDAVLRDEVLLVRRQHVIISTSKTRLVTTTTASCMATMVDTLCVPLPAL